MRSATRIRTTRHGVVQYELLVWNVVIGKDDLDKI